MALKKAKARQENYKTIVISLNLLINGFERDVNYNPALSNVIFIKVICGLWRKG
jgi:hypothetical protein